MRLRLPTLFTPRLPLSTLTLTITETHTATSTPRCTFAWPWFLSTPTSTSTSTSASTQTDTNTTPPSFPEIFISYCVQTLWIAFLFYLLSSPWRPLHLPSEREARNEKDRDEDDSEQIDGVGNAGWRIPWHTLKWEVFYGLMWLGYEEKWQSRRTPFQSRFYTEIQRRWNAYTSHTSANPFARLLEKGMIPLAVSPGGRRVTQHRSLHLSSSFPFLHLPSYTQSISRATFTFVLPHPHRGFTRTFLNRLVDNEEGCDVSVRFSTREPDGEIGYTQRSSPQTRGSKLPISVDATAPFEFLLPFRLDRALERVGDYPRLGDFLQGDGEDGRTVVPLVYWADNAVVRVEAGHYGARRVEEWVAGMAEEFIPGTRWSRGKVVAAAAKRDAYEPRLAVDKDDS